MNIIKKLLISFVLLTSFLIISPSAYAVDVYLVYAGSDKAVQKEIKGALSDLKVKSYNVDLLAMADYSGKQKAIAKISKAKVVVFIKDGPKKALEGAEFSNVVSASGAGDVGSIKSAL